MRFKIKATRYGYAEVEVDNEEELEEIMERMDEEEFDWDEINCVEVLYEILC